MININKHAEFFNPIEVKDPVHIVGCGAIGSHVAESLIRLGVDNIHLWDFDIVEPHNIANQMYRAQDIGCAKTIALRDYLKQIDPSAHVDIHNQGWKGQPLKGYIIIAADNVDVCRELITVNKLNTYTKAFLDFRMRLSDAQHYAATRENADILLKSMDFTQEEAEAATPVSACGTSLAVLPTIKIIVSLGIANFINYIKGQPLKKLILVDAFDFTIDAF